MVDAVTNKPSSKGGHYSHDIGGGYWSVCQNNDALIVGGKKKLENKSNAYVTGSKVELHDMESCNQCKGFRLYIFDKPCVFMQGLLKEKR